MNFEDYIEGASLAADLVNTRGSVSGQEYLDAASLQELLSRSGLSSDEPIQEDDLLEIRRVRERIREVFLADSEEETVRGINALLAEHASSPQLTNHDGNPWHLHFTSPDSALADRVAAAAAVGLAEAVRESGRSRLGFCSASDCSDVFIDTSRNRSRRYCHDSCSSRMNVAAYRARQRA